MKKASKIFSLLLIIAIFSSLTISLAGCGKKADITLVVYNWEDYIDEGNKESGRESVIARFESEYKQKYNKTIKIVYTTFDTNETMLTKVMNDDANVDLICPSEYAIEKLIRADKLMKIDTATIPNYEMVDDAIIGKVNAMFSDIPLGEGKVNMNDYFVPYMMGTLGILYNTEKVTIEELEQYGWGVMWNEQNNPNLTKKILMKDSIRDAYVLGLMYAKQKDLLPEAYKSMTSQTLINTVDDTLISIVEKLFKEQKAQLKGYEVDFGKDDMIKQDAYVDFAWSGDAMYAIEEGEARDVKVNLDYYVPNDEGNIWFDGWVIPKSSTNADAAKEFINYLCDPEISMLNAMQIGYTSGCDKDAIRNNEKAKKVLTDNDYDVDEFLADTRRYPDIVIDSENPKVGNMGVMRDFGDQTDKVVAMWESVKAGGPNNTIYIILSMIILAFAVTLVYLLAKKIKNSKKKLVKRVAPQGATAGGDSSVNTDSVNADTATENENLDADEKQ